MTPLVRRCGVTPVFEWSCPDCGLTGLSSTRHNAHLQLRRHWLKRCPDPRGLR